MFCKICKKCILFIIIISIFSYLFSYFIFFSLTFNKNVNLISFNILNSTIPLYKYKIITSHNSFIRGFQNFNFISTNAIEHVLYLGARGIELDIYGDNDNNPIIAHGIRINKNNNIFTTNYIKFENALKTIEEFSNKTSDPILLFLQLETNNNTILHQNIANIVQNIIGYKLLPLDYKLAKKKIFLLESIKNLLNKIIIIGGFNFNDIIGLETILDCTLKQNLVINNDHIKATNIINLNIPRLSRVYLKGSIYSELSFNYDSQIYWNIGHQLVAINLLRIDNYQHNYLKHFNNTSFLLI